MLLWLLEKIRVAFTYSKDETLLTKAHVGLKFISLVLFFIAVSLVNSLNEVFVLTTYLALLVLMSQRLKLFYESTLAVAIPIGLLGFFTWIFSPYGLFTYETFNYVLTLILRMYVLATSFLTVFSTTNPTQLVDFLEKHGVPFTLTQSLILTWRLIPLVLKDIIESIMSVRLRRFSITKALIPVTAVAIERANRVSETLYIKGLGFRTKRTHTSKPGSVFYGVILVLAATLLLVIVLIS